jgi:hypothetical protein
VPGMVPTGPVPGSRAAAASRFPTPRRHPAQAKQPVRAPTDGRIDQAPEPQELLGPPFTQSLRFAPAGTAGTAGAHRPRTISCRLPAGLSLSPPSQPKILRPPRPPPPAPRPPAPRPGDHRTARSRTPPPRPKPEAGSRGWCRGWCREPGTATTPPPDSAPPEPPWRQRPQGRGSKPFRWNGEQREGRPATRSRS